MWRFWGVERGGGLELGWLVGYLGSGFCRGMKRLGRDSGRWLGIDCDGDGTVGILEENDCGLDEGFIIQRDACYIVFLEAFIYSSLPFLQLVMHRVWRIEGFRSTNGRTRLRVVTGTVGG